eukprot:scaffold3571_cov176-Amphora_coffeaeformis.AAC.29
MKILPERSRKSSCSSLWWILVGFFAGVCVGQWFAHGETAATTTADATTSIQATRKKHSSYVTHLNEIPLQPTSHKGVDKQSLLPPFSIAENLAGLSVASIQPGQTIERHHHPTMFEFFYVISGEGYAVSKNNAQQDSFGSNSEETLKLREGSFVQTVPGDFHSFAVDHVQTKPLQMIYFGVTTDPIQNQSR